MVWMGGAFGEGSDGLYLLASGYEAGYDCDDG